MSEVTTSNTSDVSTQTPNPRPPILRTVSMPTTPTSSLAANPWYQRKFELVCSSFFFRVFFMFVVVFFIVSWCHRRKNTRWISEFIKRT